MGGRERERVCERGMTLMIMMYNIMLMNVCRLYTLCM